MSVDVIVKYSWTFVSSSKPYNLDQSSQPQLLHNPQKNNVRESAQKIPDVGNEMQY